MLLRLENSDEEDEHVYAAKILRSEKVDAKEEALSMKSSIYPEHVKLDINREQSVYPFASGPEQKEMCH